MILRLSAAAALAALALAVPASGAQAKLPCRGFCVQPDTALTAKTKTVRVGKATVGYRILGKGRTLLMVPGFAQSMDEWDPEFLDGLAKRHRVIIFDNAGIGASTAGPGEVSVAGMMSDTARLIEALKLKRPDVLGWSLGGMVAQELAIQRPDLVRRLVLAATSPGTPKATPPTQEALAVATNPDATLADRVGLLFPAARNNARQSYISRILRRPTVTLPSVTQIARQLSALTAFLADPAAALTRLRKVGARARVLVAGGAKDSVLPIANSRLLASAIPGAKLVVYPTAGHAFLFQERDKFVPRVLRFLR